MLIKNNYDCEIISKTVEFGTYNIDDENYPWYLEKNNIKKNPTDKPLLITVEFKDEEGNGYFQFWMEHIGEYDFKNLTYKSYEGIFNLENSIFTLFEITFKGFILDSNDVKTSIKIEFHELENNNIAATMQIHSEDFNLFFKDVLNIKYDKKDLIR